MQRVQQVLRHGRAPASLLAITMAVTVLVSGLGPARAGAAWPRSGGTPIVATPTAVPPGVGTAGLGNDPRFGAVQAFEAPQQASRIGVRWERVMFPWAHIQPNGPGDWNTDAAISDATIGSEIAAGRTVVGILLATPQWAARDPQYKDASVPANVDQPWNSASNNWGAFIHHIVAQYKGRIDNWIIWNEPDQYDDTKNVYNNWHGSMQDYYALMKTAYLAAHDANPGCTVVLSGLTYWWDKERDRESWLQRYLEQAAQDASAAANHDYFDAADAHLFANPLNAYAEPMFFHRIMQAHGGDKPVWITESNVIPTGDPGVPATGAFRATLDQQASFVIEDLAMGLASGAPRVSIYKMKDGPVEGNGELYGLVRNDGTTRPAYRAYAVANTYFSGTTSALYTWHADLSAPSRAEVDALLASDANRYQFVWPAAVNYVLMQRPGQRITVMWDASPITATAVITAHGSSAVVVDKAGVVTPTTPAADGAYHFTLQPSSNNSDPRDRTLYLTGGSPLILVEQMPLPTATASPTPSPTFIPRPSETPAPTATPAAFPPAQPVGPPAPSLHARYFAATRHTLSGPFLAYYNAHGQMAVVGRPLTEPWTAGKTTYQVFERLELRCSGPCARTGAGARVTVAPLGLLLTRGRRFPVLLRPLGAGARYFPATHHALGGPFLRYWLAHGGAGVLGPPISEPLHEKVPGARAPLLVQYLANARLELWLSSNGSSVRVGLLGSTYLRQQRH